MKKYFIKVTTIATESNKNFYPCTLVYLKGKKNFVELISDSSKWRPVSPPSEDYLWANYAYDRKPTRELKNQREFYEWADSAGAWKTTCEIVEK